MKVLCIGHIVYDVTLEMEDYPQENSRNKILNIYSCGGGTITNSACLLGKWGEEAYICGVVGYDAPSEKIKKEFVSFKVKTDFLETDYERKTPTSYIVLNSKTGSRTILNKMEDLPPLKKNDYSATSVDLIMLDGHEYNTAIKNLKNMTGVLSMIDASRPSKETLDLCSKVNFIVSSKEFVEQVTNIKIDKDLKKAAEAYLIMKKKFPKQEIVVTLEEQGALYSYENHIKVLPGLKVQAKDTTGAGDIFHGAFAYQYLKTKNIEQAVKFANVAAGLSVQKIGVKESFPELDEVLKYYEQI